MEDCTEYKYIFKKNNYDIIYYIIPGNPGLVEAYNCFLNNIMEYNNTDVIIVGHLGHCSTSRGLYKIKDQVEHHKKHYLFLKKKYKTVKVIGHSFGAYIIIKLLEEGIKIDKGILIAPVISKFFCHNKYSLLTYRPIKYSLHLIFFLFPSLVKKYNNFSDKINYYNFRENIVYLLEDKLKELKMLPEEILIKNKNNLLIYYPLDDQYVDPNIMKRVSELVDNTKILTITHAFALSVIQSDVLARMLE